MGLITASGLIASFLQRLVVAAMSRSSVETFVFCRWGQTRSRSPKTVTHPVKAS